MEYRLVRSSRKTLSMQITQQGELVVRAPNRCPKDYIDRFVASKEAWIRENMKKVLGQKNQRNQFRPLDRETLNFCGTSLQVVPTKDLRVTLDWEKRRILLPDVSVEELLPALAKVYKQAGKPYLEARLQYWSGVTGISYSQMKLNSALRRWGSCSQEGNINLSWFLLFAPEEAIDYVLVHELCHRRHFNHSKAFWALVEQFMPDYQDRKKLLLQVQEQLVSEGWSVKS